MRYHEFRILKQKNSSLVGLDWVLRTTSDLTGLVFRQHAFVL